MCALQFADIFCGVLFAICRELSADDGAHFAICRGLFSVVHALHFADDFHCARFAMFQMTFVVCALRPRGSEFGDVRFAERSNGCSTIIALTRLQARLG